MKVHLKKSGISLVELLVVLTILAVLTTIAVQSTSGVIEQGRFEATQKTLENVRSSILGDTPTTTTVTGFVADMGRLPASLDELLAPPADASVYGLHPAPSPHADVLVPRGWRGPYVRLPIGSFEQGMNQLRDGWGTEFTSGKPTPNSFLAISPGTNRSGGNSAYNTDIGLTIAAEEWQATLITGTLYQGSPTTDEWQVTLFAPGPASVNSGVTSHPATIVIAPNGDISYTITSGLSIGPRVLRATKNGINVGNPVYLTLRPGATHVVNFYRE